MDLYGLTFFQQVQKSKHPKWITSLLSCGLSFLRGLAELDVKSQRDVVLECHPTSRPFLREALGELPQGDTAIKGHYKNQKVGTDLCFDPDSLESWNMGWLWAANHKVVETLRTAYGSNLRRWGFVIWDSDRLMRSGVLTELSKVKNKKPEDRNRWRMPSAERRLKGVLVRRDVLNKLASRPQWT
ncbi:hypothetical protein MMC06_004755 [Schaereria dolodes]|nr:hypothetical protein [Schaereria dolodes]